MPANVAIAPPWLRSLLLSLSLCIGHVVNAFEAPGLTDFATSFTSIRSVRHETNISVHASHGLHEDSHGSLRARIKNTTSTLKSNRTRRDNIAWERFLDVSAGVHFVQVGANCGMPSCAVWGEPIWNYATHYGWTGAALEPNPAIFEKLKSNYAPYPNVRPLQLAGAGESGHLDFYIPTHSSNATEWATLSMEHFKKHCGNCPAPKVVSVRAVTLPELWWMLNFPKIDILVVDAEGYDAQILLCNMQQLSSAPGGLPKVVLYESVHISPAETATLSKHMTATGYVFVEATPHDHLWKLG